ncbi:sugar phosphate isomerase/epimerase family protein [Poritiphilus flavus]|uniref:TIM barrel protein n=1 Tax=Poritiphilus flavus TaxID=2697053 RepID=A0A6L9EAH1_9FLAO|nr:sugar phosphate isomerase/epimerase family protein [Poritiphilus flavus]NAS11548.1 TIM barrel protein [Poritiphilus flavus]
MKRREFIKNSSTAALAAAIPAMPSFSPLLRETRFGVAEASYLMRWYRNMESEKYPPFKLALDMIEHCAALGFGGVQVNVRGWDKKYANKVKRRVESDQLFLEGQISLPKDESDVDRFESQIRIATEAGIDIFRTVCLSGRRYENFDTMEAFEEFRKNSLIRLQLAEPLARKHKVKLAVENHKDFRIAGMMEVLKAMDSEWIGVTLDTGNNISLLEDPMEVVKALAPFAFSVHLKDMAVEEYGDGFLLSEVNLGEGILDIEGMIQEIRSKQPEARFNLEMITRDPLKIPCLTEKYWATFDKIPAVELAVFLKGIREQKSTKPLAIVTDKPTDKQLNLEVTNNRVSLEYAKKHLGFK